MRLKEFDLDAPMAEKWVRHAFREQTRCVTAHYERHFQGLETESAWKFLVECVPGLPRAGSQCVLGVFTVQSTCDFEAFEGADDERKKELSLEILHAGVVRACERENWPLSSFENARDGVVGDGYKNEWVWGIKTAHGRTLVASVRCQHEVRTFRAWLEVRHKGNAELVRQVTAFESKPSEFVFAPKLGKLVWSGANRVSLVGSDGQDVSSIEL